MSEEKEPRRYRLKVETAHFGQSEKPHAVGGESGIDCVVVPDEAEEFDNEFWEKVNQEAGLDVISIVMDHQHGRVDSSKTMERIAARCETSAKLAVRRSRLKGKQ